MNPRYREVFRSHPILFLLPIVLGGAVALWVALAAPTQYRSSATLWVDTASASSGSLGSSGSVGSAGREQDTLNELLATGYFQNLVAHGSPLAQYLEDHPAEGWGPTGLLARLRSSASLDDRIAAALGSDRVRSTVKGPHVLQVTYDAPTPELATVTLGAILNELIRQRVALRDDALAVATKNVNDASKALASARSKLTRYLEAGDMAKRGPQLRALVAAERTAARTLAGAAEEMSEATTSLVSADSPQTSLRIVDTPERPRTPISGKRQVLLALLAGLFAGALVSVLGIVAVAKAKRDAPRAESEGEDANSSSDGSPVWARSMGEAWLYKDLRHTGESAVPAGNSRREDGST